MTTATQVQTDTRFSVIQENLRPALAAVVKVVDTRPLIPVLHNVHLRAEGSRLFISGTDLQTSIIVTIGAKVDQPGEITLPAKTFNELVNNLSNERIDFRIDHQTNTATVKCGSTRTSIKGLDAAEFPPMYDATQDVNILHRFEIPGKTLKDLIGSTAFSAAREDNRPILMGIYLEFGNDTVTAAAADGFRLAVCKRAVPTNGQTAAVVVPAAPLSNLIRMIDERATVRLTIGKQGDVVQFLLDDVDFTVQTINGRFPAFDAIVPKQFSTEAIVYTEDLKNAARRALIFARDSANSVRLDLIPPTQPNEPGEIQVIGKSAERGDVDTALDAAIHGDKAGIAVNAGYLQDVLSVIHEERTLLKLNGSSAPMVAQPENDPDSLCVIMPMSA